MHEVLKRSCKLEELTLEGEQIRDIEFICPYHVRMLDIHALRSRYINNWKTENFKLRI